MADVLLTHSYHLPHDRKQLRKMQPYPPLGTLYAASLLREQGVSVAVFDPMLAEPKHGFSNALRTHKPKVVAIYEDDFNFLTKMCLTAMRELVWEMAKEAQQCGARVAVHGSDATDHAEEFLQRGCDWVLCGESERTLLELCKPISGGQESIAIPGVLGRDWTRTSAGAADVRTIPAKPHIRFPLPARDLVNMDEYREAWRAAHGYFSMNLIASRGCPYRCNWCAKPIFGNGFAMREAADVAEEMALLKESYGAEHLWFSDDIFALSPRWVDQFAAEVSKRNCAVPFKIQARADRLSARTVEALREAGCAEVWMGVESGSQKILDAMDKDLRVEAVVEARRHLNTYGIQACYFLQFGYPGEDREDLEKTIALVRETKPDDIGVSFSYPLPNTPFYLRVKEQLGTKQNWLDSEDLCVMFRGAYTDKYYRAVRDALHLEVEEMNGRENGTKSQDLWKLAEELELTSRNDQPTLGGETRAIASGRQKRTHFVSILSSVAAPSGSQ